MVALKSPTFPNEQLSSGNQQKGIEQVAAGVTGASLHSTIIYSVIEPKLAVVSMPWIMPNNAAVDKAMKGAPGEKNQGADPGQRN